jgi:N-acetylglucosaminyldiphosphoundecaprenol N-acetyl-beta-D-mannosaminyltransferase
MENESIGKDPDALDVLDNCFKGNGQQLVSRILSLPKTSPNFVGYLNSHTFYLLNKQEEILRYYQSCQLIYVDGKGPEWAFRFLGLTKATKHTSADFLPALLREVEARQLKVFIIGHQKEQLSIVRQYLRQQFPQLFLGGTQTGFYLDDRTVCRQLQQSEADIVLLGMGSPKQETFLLANQQQLPNAIYLPLGAGLLYLSQQVTRAPAWLRAAGGEWLFRLLQDPQRLFMRYWRANLFLVKWLFQKTLRR